MNTLEFIKEVNNRGFEMSQRNIAQIVIDVNWFIKTDSETPLITVSIYLGGHDEAGIRNNGEEFSWDYYETVCPDRYEQELQNIDDLLISYIGGIK